MGFFLRICVPKFQFLVIIRHVMLLTPEEHVDGAGDGAE